MRIVEKKQNRELVYELSYDEEKIKSLISEIIVNCSIRRNGRYRVEARTDTEAFNKINSSMIWENIKTYENICDIRAEEVNDPCDYWRHGDPSPYSFCADILIVPDLVVFLICLVNDKDVDYDWFVNRRELSKKQELELEIQQLDLQINGISNFETDRKIEMLKKLSRKVKYLNEMPNFDYDVLSGYYSIAQEYIELELVQETINYSKKRNMKNN